MMLPQTIQQVVFANFFFTPYFMYYFNYQIIFINIYLFSVY